MKTAKLFFLVAIFSGLIFSCSHGFLKDPRLYNPKKAQQESSVTIAPEPELHVTGGVDTFDLTEEWFNKPNSNGDGKNPDKVDFPYTEFENMSLVGTYFNDSNVPVYAMKQENVWVSKDTDKAEFVHANAPDTEGQGYAISNVHWYQYRGKNPLYAADGSYNTQLQTTAKGNPKLSRFNFYRFTGDTLSPSLDNFLFAVDTYSKLMFAFAYPTDSKSVFGNNVPTAWGPTDGSTFLGTTYQFYMYDPVGYVEKVDGNYNVVMYDWFKANLAKGVYQPTLGGLDAKSQGTPYTEAARKEAAGAGTSPFNNNAVDFFKENMKLLSGATFQCREILADGSNGLVLYKYTVDKDATKITRTAESWNDLPTTTTLDPVTYTIGEGESATKGTLTDNQGKKLSFELTDEARTLTITGDNASEVAFRNFSDLGPDFIQRVAHEPYYKSTDGKITYTFKDKGKTLVFENDGTTYNYTYEQPRNDTNRNCAVYGSDDALMYYAGFELSNQDSTIKTSKTSGAWASTFVWDMTYEAQRNGDISSVPSEEDLKAFYDAVKSQTFTTRNVENGVAGLELLTWSFDGTGQAGTLKKKLYPTDTESTVVTIGAGRLVALSKTKGFFSAEDKTQYTFTIESDSLLVETSTLASGTSSLTHSKNYEDKGPGFINRVKGKTYVEAGKTKENGYSYTFSSDGKTCTYKNPNAGLFQTKEKTYTYESDKEKGHWNEYTYATYSSYFIDVKDGSDSKKDSVLRMENTSAAVSYAIADMEWEATLSNQ